MSCKQTSFACRIRALDYSSEHYITTGSFTAVLVLESIVTWSHTAGHRYIYIQPRQRPTSTLCFANTIPRTYSSELSSE
jgi:hypothetical protein